MAKPKYIPSSDHHKCSIGKERTSNIVLNPYNLWDMHTATVTAFNYTIDRDSMSNQYPQTTVTHPKTDLSLPFSSLRPINSKRKGLHASFALFQRNYVPDGRLDETVAMVEESSHLWNPGAMDVVPPLVMNCSCI